MILAMRSPSFLPESVAGFLFERHLVWWVAVAALGAILLLISRGRSERKMRWGGFAALIAVGVWVLGAVTVDTPGERLHAAHVALAKAASQHDVDGILAFCEPHFSIESLDIRQDSTDARGQIKARLEEFGIKETTFTRYDTGLTSGGATSHFVAITESGMGLIQTTWEVYWEDVPGEDWRIHSATLLKVGDQAVPTGEVVR